MRAPLIARPATSPAERSARPAAARLAHGEPLQEATRSFFEGRLQHDFSRVRIHADGAAAAAAEDAGAKAYTVGSEIVFGAGRYAPSTAEGTRLLAHELTHVVQQQRGGSAAAGGWLRNDSAAEREARQAAAAIARGESYAPAVSSATVVARDQLDGGAPPGGAPEPPPPEPAPAPEPPAAAPPAAQPPAAQAAPPAAPPALSTLLTGINADISPLGSPDVVTAQAEGGSQVKLVSPGVDFFGHVSLRQDAALGTDKIQVGFIQTVTSERIGVYRKGGDPNGEVVRESRLQFGPTRDTPDGSGAPPPFYMPPLELTQTARAVEPHTADHPKGLWDAALGEGKLTETKGSDRFAVSLAAQRGTELAHLKDLSWSVPWSLTLAADKSGKGGQVAINNDSHDDPATPAGPAANEVGRDPASTVKAYMTPGAADAGLKENPTAFIADLPHQKAKAPDSYWQMVGALWRSPLNMHVKVTVLKTDSTLGADDIDVVATAHTSAGGHLKLNDGQGGEVELLAHTVYDPGKLDASTTVDLKINQQTVHWAFPYKSLTQDVSAGSGRYSVEAFLK